jgi:glycine cleavage system aminomethyltransferase T/glycine/D-amino acid oxidase-like deaminating enzyme
MSSSHPSASPAPRALPARARVVVVGGGVIGCSVAYHLAEAGEDVLLLERDRLTSGTTWHAAGLMVTFGSTSETSTRLRRYTLDLYARLEAETGQSTGLRQVGLVELATDADRLQEYRRIAAFDRYCGVDVHEIGPDEVGKLFPPATVDDVLAGFYVPQDGRANPVDVTMALAKGARLHGATILERTPVLGVLTAPGPGGRRRVRGVRTAQGDVEAEVVVNCAGMWARQLGEADGVALPLQAAEHYYLIVDGVDGVTPDLPVLEDPAAYGYYREETGGLMVGLFEPVAAPWRLDGVPEDFSFGTLPPDWDRMTPWLEAAMRRVPGSLTGGVRTFFCGPESFTPDLSPLVGEAPEVTGYFVAAGMNSIGILTGGGIGRVLARWIVDGRPDVDVTAMTVERVQPWQATREYRRTRTVEVLGTVYAPHYPHRSMRTARGVKRSALHDRLAAAGASFRDVSGWEGAAWFGEPGHAPPEHPLTWGRPGWFGRWAAEHRAVREAAGVFDMSFMAKFLVQGADAGAFLDHVSANRVDGPHGRVTYTPWLNDGGTVEADLTVTKLDDDRYLVVASDTIHRHVQTWLRGALAADCFRAATVTDVTSAFTLLSVQGPRSREVLQSLTTADLATAAFPFRTAREIDLGFARALCLRITYVGELGYELYVPTEHAVDVYDRLIAAGAQAGLRPVGLQALGSLRLEKGYRDYGHDLDNTDRVDDAGLGFAVAMGKPGGFLGREAVAAHRAAGPPRQRLVQVLLSDPEPLLHHAEVVRRSGRPVGYVRAASYGHTLGSAVGLAMVALAPGERGPLDQAWIDAARWEVDVAGVLQPASLSLSPLYDPGSERVRG